jgi:hypothetical protein
LVETILRQPECWVLVQSEQAVASASQVKPLAAAIGHAPAMAASPAF